MTDSPSCRTPCQQLETPQRCAHHLELPIDCGAVDELGELARLELAQQSISHGASLSPAKCHGHC